jgi:ABC-type transport system involved in cytochrome bd biosynthesis fused ATPase/permease subunit
MECLHRFCGLKSIVSMQQTNRRANQLAKLSESLRNATNAVLPTIADASKTLIGFESALIYTLSFGFVVHY